MATLLYSSTPNRPKRRHRSADQVVSGTTRSCRRRRAARSRTASAAVPPVRGRRTAGDAGQGNVTPAGPGRREAPDAVTRRSVRLPPAQRVDAPPRRAPRGGWIVLYRTCALRRAEARHPLQEVDPGKQPHTSAQQLGNLYLTWADGSSARTVLQLLQMRGAGERATVRAGDRLRPVYHHAPRKPGNARLALKDLEGAERSLLEALEYQPDYPDARNDLDRRNMIRHADPPCGRPYAQDRPRPETSAPGIPARSGRADPCQI